MRGFETAILQHFNSNSQWLELYSTRVYPVLAPAGTTRPYVTYHLAGEFNGVHLGGGDGLAERRLSLQLFTKSHQELDHFSQLMVEIFHGMNDTAIGDGAAVNAFTITATPGDQHGYRITSTEMLTLTGAGPPAIPDTYVLADFTIDGLREDMDGDNGRTLSALEDSQLLGLPASDLAATTSDVMVADGAAAQVTHVRLPKLQVRGAQVVSVVDLFDNPTDGSPFGTFRRAVDILFQITQST